MLAPPRALLRAEVPPEVDVAVVSGEDELEVVRDARKRLAAVGVPVVYMHLRKATALVRRPSRTRSRPRSRRAKIETPRLACSPARRLIGFEQRSREPAERLVSPCSRRTTCVTGGSASCIGRAARGRRLRDSSASASSQSLRTPTHT